MKSSVLKLVAKACVVLIVVSVLSSCNKGYGCTNNFKVTPTFTIPFTK